MMILVTISIGLAGADRETTIEIDDEELAGLDETERTDTIEGYARDAAFEVFEWSWEEVV